MYGVLLILTSNLRLTTWSGLKSSEGINCQLRGRGPKQSPLIDFREYSICLPATIEQKHPDDDSHFLILNFHRGLSYSGYFLRTSSDHWAASMNRYKSRSSAGT